ncbi:MAG: hypothetical protein AB7T59_05590 [Hyphomonadaceae bacterium]
MKVQEGNRASTALLLTLCAAAAPATALADGWSYSTGADYTQGDYGAGQDTSIVVAPLSARYDAERWRAALTITYVSVEGAGGVIPGAGSAFGAGSPLSSVADPLFGVGGPAQPPLVTPSVEAQGLGDTTLELGFTPLAEANGARISLSGAVRLPTGNEERSLGAGETVFSLAAGAAHPVGQRSAVYAAIGYTHAAESDDGAAFASGGFESRIADSWVLGASGDWSDSRVAGAAGRTQLTLYSGFSLSTDVQLAAYALAGLSDTAPELGGGIRLTVR